ncbi:hypothetical protein PG993_012031 [Apiospora rasikravindrae]|uniref:ABC transmembrane type-1 domain-containing protein n=1 Tax=Apiospora rasikravindrae TaxID=990691 RepID=A0ABR1S1D9_9PEZI
MIWAPESFFKVVDTGVTTNSFSQDIILVDGAAPYVAIVYRFLLAILPLVQSFYLKTSRQLRFLNFKARNPLQTHLRQMIQGLAAIRTFGWARPSIEANHNTADASQKPVYLLYMVQRWIQLGGFLGAALIQLMPLDQELKLMVINYTILETSLAAISRMKAFDANMPSENRPSDDSDKHTTPPPSK